MGSYHFYVSVERLSSVVWVDSLPYLSVWKDHCDKQGQPPLLDPQMPTTEVVRFQYSSLGYLTENSIFWRGRRWASCCNQPCLICSYIRWKSWSSSCHGALLPPYRRGIDAHADDEGQLSFLAWWLLVEKVVSRCFTTGEFIYDFLSSAPVGMASSSSKKTLLMRATNFIHMDITAFLVLLYFSDDKGVVSVAVSSLCWVRRRFLLVMTRSNWCHCCDLGCIQDTSRLNLF